MDPPGTLSYLLPLVDVSDEAWEAEQPQQTEDLGEPDDAKRPRRLVHLRVEALLHNQKDIIHGNGGEKIHHKPALQVVHLNHFGVQDDLRALLIDDSRAEVHHQVHQEDGVRGHVEYQPGGCGLLGEERNSYRNDD